LEHGINKERSIHHRRDENVLIGLLVNAHEPYIIVSP
jgi:hypothetical protein